MPTIRSTLNETAKAFQFWRDNRKAKQEPTPLSLIEQAIALLDNHSIREITQALNLSYANFRRWCNDFEGRQLEQNRQAIPDSTLSGKLRNSTVNNAPQNEAMFVKLPTDEARFPSPVDQASETENPSSLLPFKVTFPSGAVLETLITFAQFSELTQRNLKGEL